MIGEVVVDRGAERYRVAQHELARLERGDGLPVEEQDGVAEHGGNSRTDREHADEVQRVGCRHLADLRVRARHARAAQLVERFAQAELLADEPVHEPPTANLPARLEAAECDEQIAPRRQARFALQEIAKHDAVAREQLPRARFDIACRRRDRGEQRPPPGTGGQRPQGMRWTLAVAIARAPDRFLPLAHRRHTRRGRIAIERALHFTALAIHEHAQAREPVRGREAGSDELPQRVFELLRAGIERLDEVAQERRAARSEMVAHARGERGQHRRFHLRDRRTCPQPPHIAAQHQRERCRPRRRIARRACRRRHRIADERDDPERHQAVLADERRGRRDRGLELRGATCTRVNQRGFERRRRGFELRRLFGERRGHRRIERAAHHPLGVHRSTFAARSERAPQRRGIEVRVRRGRARRAPGLVAGSDRFAQRRRKLLERRHRARDLIDRGHDLRLLLGRELRLGLGLALPRREPAPHDLPAQAQLIEPLRIVAVQPRRQDLALPRTGRSLEALQLLEHAPEPIRTDQLRAARHALPAQQEPHQRRRAHRFDLAPELRERQAMDAREHAAIAPLGLGELVAIVRDHQRLAHRP